VSTPVELNYEFREAIGQPQGALVLLHGRGADEHDLLPLADVLDPEHRLHVLSPRGPLSLPPGGHHWYVVERVGYPDPETFKRTYQTLDQCLRALSDRTGVAPERTVLGGFSQGSVMAYALSLGRGRPTPAGVLALSGFIPSVPGFDLELEGREGLPVAIGHGSFDPVIPVGFAHEAEQRLTAAQLAVSYRESPIAHSIDPAFLLELHGWLGQILAPATG
jgi:phospholipase/carboxylesterase